MPKRHALRWFAFKAHGVTWRVVGTTRTDIEDAARSGRVAVPEESISGLTVYTRRTVLVDAGLSRDEQDETLLHEVMHVSLANDRTLRRADEERAITQISPELLPLLVVSARLRWPRRPAGWAALEKLARSLHK